MDEQHRRSLRLPESLRLDADAAWRSDDDAVVLVRRYFDRQDTDDEFTGSFFDEWRVGDPNEITADDLLAVEFLGVAVPPRAARAVLGPHRARIRLWLEAAGEDRDLAGSPGRALHEDEALVALWRLLTGHRDVGPVIASKILARKRPRLVPIVDRKVCDLVGVHDHYWLAWGELFERHPHLDRRLQELRRASGAGPHVSTLRVLDVALWMHATHDVVGDLVTRRRLPRTLGSSDRA